MIPKYFRNLILSLQIKNSSITEFLKWKKFLIKIIIITIQSIQMI